MPESQPIFPDTLLQPERLLYGRGKTGSLLGECARYGSRGVLVYGAALASGGRAERLCQSAPLGMEILPYRHSGAEPTLAAVTALLAAARAHKADWIAGVGGGSVLDLAKSAAALFRTSAPPRHYHDGGVIETPGVTFIAVPSTAGTGAEATLNAVLTNESTGAKKSIRDAGLMARLVILDPDLIATCPPAVVAASGMDALTQAIEAFTSRHATVFSDALAIEALRLIAGNVAAVYRDPAAPAAAELLGGSFMAGVALSTARLGVVHGLAHPLGALYDLPHGLVCALCLPHAVELNRTAYGGKYGIMSHAAGGDLLDTIRALGRELDIRSPLSGQPVRNRDMICRETLASGSTKANPKPITPADVDWLLDRIFL